MVINYLCWSTLISCIATALLYPLRHHSQGAKATRLCAAVFLFPSLVSSIIVQLFIRKSDVILLSISHLALVNTDIGFQLTSYNAIFIIFINLSLIILVFLLSNRFLCEYLALSAMVGIFIFFTVASSHLIIKLAAFSLGTVFVLSFFIAGEYKEVVGKFVVRDFVINRLSDLLAFSSFIHASHQPSALPISYHIFFLSLILRLISIGLSDELTSSFSLTAIRIRVLYGSLISTGTQLLLFFYFAHDAQKTIRPEGSVAILIVAYLFFLMATIAIGNKLLTINHAQTLAVFINIAFIVYSMIKVATIVICATILLCPLMLFSWPIARRESERVTVPGRAKSLPHAIHQIFIIMPKTAVVTIAVVFINIINYIYSGFMLFRFPQFLLAVIQIPLRFLNNGSIQRSLLFLMVTLIAYSFWWR